MKESGMRQGYPSSLHLRSGPDKYIAMYMIECSLCTLQNQVMHIVVERSDISSGFPGSIMKLVSHRQALNGLYYTQLKSVHCAHVLLLPPLYYTLMCTTCYPSLFLF